MTRQERELLCRQAIRYIRQNRIFPYRLRWLLIGLAIGMVLKLCYLNYLARNLLF